MNPTTPDHLTGGRPVAPDDLDRLLSDFFKSRVPSPWPAVRLPEPSALLAVRNEEPAPRPRPVAPDPGSRARLTLAVSAALLLGTCWYLSNGSQPADRPAANPAPAAGSGLKDAGAEEKGILNEMRQHKAREAKDPAAGFVPGPITLP